jgi:hypothetical protein
MEVRSTNAISKLLPGDRPQIAVAIDRTVLKDKAGEIRTALGDRSFDRFLNRRYLEKRLVEEIQRRSVTFPDEFADVDVDESSHTTTCSGIRPVHVR